MPVETLPQFYDLMRSTVPVRREAVAEVIAGRSAPGGVVDRLRDALAALESIPEEAEGRRLRLSGIRPIHLDLGYEIEELRKDLVFLTQGEEALLADLEARHERFREEVDSLAGALGGRRYQAFVSDRDGTVNNYCGRYASSVQSAYNAVFLARFARGAARQPVVLTSAPLDNVGLLDLAVTPAGAFIYAGSKGREYVDARGRRRRYPIDAARQQKLDEFNRRLDDLLKAPGNEPFALIGSGLQHKFGQTTVARQDIAASVPTEKSERFLSDVRALVQGIDPTGDRLRIEDTGLDVEIVLTVDDEGDGLRDFDKGDGVRFLNRDVPVEMEAGPCLVCGDTASDVPMLVAARELSPAVDAVFVTRGEEPRERVRSVHPTAHFVSEPDVLVTALAALAGPAGGE